MPADKKFVNGRIPTASARQAAWLLAGGTCRPPLSDPATRVSAGEEERLELVAALAERIETCGTAELAVCRRLLEHLRGRDTMLPATSRLQ